MKQAQAAPHARATAGFGPPDAPGVGSVVRVGTDSFGEGGEEAREQRVGRRVEAEGGCAVGKEVEVLGAAYGAAVHRLDVDQARLAQPLEVQPHRVRMEAEPFRKILRGEGIDGARELAVHGEARLVAERLQHRQLIGRSGHCA